MRSETDRHAALIRPLLAALQYCFTELTIGIFRSDHRDAVSEHDVSHLRQQLICLSI